MSLSLADIYYIKAMDEYPYALEFTVENLNYALSYDPEHAAANCLMGRLYLEQLKDLEMAEQFLETSIAIDPDYAEAYVYYILLSFAANDLGKARKLVDYSKKLTTINKSRIAFLEALLLEKERKYHEAIKFMELALIECNVDEKRLEIKNAIERVEEKIDLTNPYSYTYGL